MKFEPKYTKDSFSNLEQYGVYVPTIANLIVELHRAYAEIEMLELERLRAFEEGREVFREKFKITQEALEHIHIVLKNSGYGSLAWVSCEEVACEALEKVK